MQVDSNLNNCPDIDIENYDFSNIDRLQRRICDVMQQLKKPLNYILPPDFQSKFQQAKQYTILDNQWIEKYKQIIAYMIQGQINLSLMGLTLKFINQFRGQTSFWMDLIFDFSQNQKYDENLRMWQVNDRYKECLPLPIIQYEKIRKFRKLAKNDINTSKNLLTLLCQLKNSIDNPTSSKKRPQDIITKINLLTQKHQQSDQKFISFLKIYHQVVDNVNFFHSSTHLFGKINLSLNNFKKSIKNQGEGQNSKTKKSQKINNNESKVLKQQQMISYFSHQSYKETDNVLINKLRGLQKSKQLSKQEKEIFDEIINSISQPKKLITSLRQQFKNQVNNEKKPLLKQTHSHYCNIFIQKQFFFYQNFFIPLNLSSQFNLIQPFQQKSIVNYDIASEDFYEEYMGDDIQNSDQNSDQDDDEQESLNSEQKRQFCDFQDNLDAYIMSDDQKELHKNAIEYSQRKIEGKFWVYDYRDQKSLQIRSINYESTKCQFSKISSNILLDFVMIECPCQIPMQINEDQNNLDEISEYQLIRLKELINNKSRKQIFRDFDENDDIQNRISKEKLINFINKKTKKIKRKFQGHVAVVYLVIESNQEKIENDQNQNFTEQDTVFELEKVNQLNKQQEPLNTTNANLNLNKINQKKVKRKILSKRFKKKQQKSKIQSINEVNSEVETNFQKSQQQSSNFQLSNTRTLRSKSRTIKVNYNLRQMQKRAYSKKHKSQFLQNQI